ncbi:MAG: NAD+ synthase [Pseudomonadales bacterium]|nr:NAD+ synthase [Pseudomonadales bacterium]
MARQLRVVMAQKDFLVGDIQGNTAQVLESAQTAITEFKADVIVFPELALTGYPPEDLLFRPSMMIRVNRALAEIQAAGLDIVIILGHPWHENGCLFNAASVIHGGKILANYAKQRLPNYQVFDERRYFTPGEKPCVVRIKGIAVALTICEDMWVPEPGIQAREAGAEVIITINASPFHTNKLMERQALLSERAEQCRLPIIYTNLVGGQDELVFDGASMAVGSDGRCRVLAPAFSAGLFVVNLAEHAGCMEIEQGEIAEIQSIEASIYQALTLGLQDYAGKNGFKSVVLGLSGGIDSALTLAIAVDALGAEKVQAVMMPFTYTSQLSVDLARAQATRLGVHFSTIAIKQPFDAFSKVLAPEFAGLAEDVTEQNMQARCRGVILMAISNKKGALVLTTGNKSEIAVGYSTLYGDMAGGFDVLKDVAKTLVYRLANYRNQLEPTAAQWVIPQAVIDRPPSAELAPGQVDQDNLPPYDQLDEILELYVEKDFSAHEIIARGYAQETVRRVLRLVDLNEYKRRQSPIGVRLTKRGFGRDRRYPITSGWQIGD